MSVQVLEEILLDVEEVVTYGEPYVAEVSDFKTVTVLETLGDPYTVYGPERVDEVTIGEQASFSKPYTVYGPEQTVGATDVTTYSDPYTVSHTYYTRPYIV